MITLAGKVAIVTGGANGIGRAIAELFSEAGAAVVVADLEEPVDMPGIVCRRADVSVEDDAKRVVRIASGITGRIDVLCNNAAWLGPAHAAREAAGEEWERSIAVSLMGTQYMTREALAWMVPQASGSIINIASVQAMVGARNSVAYTTVKAGLLGFTRSVAYDYGCHNIRVNAICPGAISTRISPKPDDELYQRQISKTFLGRVGEPRDVAWTALFLASDAASYITGAVIPVDGGWTAM
jgi:NAD(P)-dependent dehydrogenase (short-subunit alcohol dehydrogenase family)